MIVGAGPIGIELAAELKRREIEYVHVEAGRIASTIQWYAPQTQFFSSPERIAIAGVPLHTADQSKATREEYLAYLRGVVELFDLQIRTETRVVDIEPGTPHGVVTERRGERERWECETLILAIGDMHKPRLLHIKGEDLPHVCHYFDDPHSYFRRKVLVVGGKNSAVEAAIRCVRVGADVTLAHRGESLDEERIKFWLLPELEAMIRDGRMEFLSRTKLVEIQGNHAVLSTDRGSDRMMPVDDVLLMTGYEQDSTLFEDAGIEMHGPGRAPVFDADTMETNVAGIYVVGTATAGTQIGGVREFIETSHIHVDRVVAAMTGQPPPSAAPEWTLPES